MVSSLRSILLLVAATAVSVVGVEAQAVAPAKVAIVNAQKAVADTQEIKKAQADLEAKYRPRQQSMEALQRDLQSIQQQLSAPNLTPDREAQLRQSGTEKQKQLQRLSEDLQSDVNNERQDILGRAGRQMAQVVKKIAEQRGIDVVIDVTNTIYYRPALDITPEATAEYDKAYPVGAAGGISR
ncbi:MAG TPA: OmpH family outer membrane protein [Bryobacteraceae bacterium]|jgi:outer membrane protein